MEYYENNQKEFEETLKAVEEVEANARQAQADYDANCDECGEHEVTLSEQNWGLLYNLRDAISTFDEAQLSTLTQLIKDTRKANLPKARLYAEAETLFKNIESLDKFLRRIDMKTGEHVTTIMGITDAQVYLMRDQLELERKLYNVLVARYSIFDARVKNAETGELEIVKE